MSVESMAIVLHHSQSAGNARLVMIGIANHDGDGGAWPSIDTLAKYANVSPRTVQRLLPELEELGEIRIIQNGGGLMNHRNDRRPNRYEVLVACPPDCDGTSQHRKRDTVRRGDNSVTPSDGHGVTTPATRGDNSVVHGVTLLSPEPSLEPPVNRGGARRASTAAGPSPDSPPPTTCPDHPNGTTQPCRACGAASRAREAWDRDQTQAREHARVRTHSERLRREDAEARRTAAPPPVDLLRSAVRKTRTA